MAEYARYFAADSAERRASGFHDSRRAGGNALERLRIYSGFELCEAALPGREEYLDSEKYQFKERDWGRARKHQGLYRAPEGLLGGENRALSFHQQPAFLQCGQ